jgi:hypothetical protein
MSDLEIPLYPLISNSLRSSIMKRQFEIEETMFCTYQRFMVNLEKSLCLLSQDIDDTKEETYLGTEEWCFAVEEVLDELAELIFTINKPRWLSKNESKRVNGLHQLIHDLYTFMIYMLVTRQSKNMNWKHPLLFLATCDYLIQGNEIFGNVPSSIQEVFMNKN